MTNKDAFCRIRDIICLALALLLAACAAPHREAALPRLDPAAERLFHADPRWLGGDAAISIPLGQGRILWLFGDSFVDPEPPYSRAQAAFPRNTLAVQTGADPAVARMAFFWRHDTAGAPASAFPEDGADWFWPGEGVRLDDGSLAVFLQRVHAVTGGFGFETAGFAVMVIANPDDPPARWRMTRFRGPALPFDALSGAAVLRDGPNVVALAVKQAGTHAGTFMRLPAAALARGDFSAMEWWAGERRGWVKTEAVGASGPDFVIDDAGAEASLDWDACRRVFVHVASTGFGATEIAERTAPALTGPWSAPRRLFRPPESDAPNPFVYAGRAHEDLAAPQGARALSYVANSFTPDDLMTNDGAARLYWPRIAFVAAPSCE